MAVVKEATEALKVRPGQNAHRATPRVLASTTHLPRTVVYASPRRRVVRPGATGSPRAPLQEEATNAHTGRKAAGPWMGPFAAASDNLLDNLIPNTIYMDSTGGCHLNLDPSDDRRMSQELYKAQSDSGLLSDIADEAAAKVADQQLQLRREKHMQARAAQAHSMLLHAGLDKATPVKNVFKRMHVINQPRRFN